MVHVPGRSAETEAMVLWVMRRFEGDMVPALRAALDDADQCVRETAARLFDHTGNRTRAVQALSDAIRSSNLNTQLAAVMAMGYVEDRTLVPLLTERMTHRDPAMRQTVAWALGQLEHPDAVPVLARALGDRDVRVRANAAYALGRIERRAAVDPLADALRDADASVRINAAWALGQIEDEAAIPALADLLQRDQNAEVRRAAAWALGKIE